MSGEYEKLDHEKPAMESLADILRKMLDAGAVHAELVAQVGDMQVRFLVTIAGVRQATGEPQPGARH